MPTNENLNISQSLTGFVKIWKTHQTTGESQLVLDQKNMILKGGAKIIAHALGGDQYSKIWGMYIGYNNGTETFIKPGIDVDYSNKFLNYTAPFGYLREPLTFTPTYQTSLGYDENVVLFSTMITSATKAGGASFDTSSRIYEVALVSAVAADDLTKDTVFSRTNFNPIQYNSSYNFTITWGVRILLP
jgi:hypothetical protein